MEMPTCGYRSLYRADHSCDQAVWEESKHGRCIFHEPGKEKDVELFNQAIICKLEAKDYDFTGYVFPDATDYFDGHTFETTAYFIGSIFLGDTTSFNAAEFRGELTDFSWTVFGGKLTYFGDAKFNSEKSTNFAKAKFRSDFTSFSHATFSSTSTHFSDAEFSGTETIFSDVNFSGESTFFSRAKFLSEESTNFSNATFSRSNAYFTWAEFAGELTFFIEAKFSGISADFSGARFTAKRTDFSRASFQKGCAPYFQKAEFSNVAEFTHTAFLNGASFQQSKFFGYTDFIGAEFQHSSSFIDAEFLGQAIIFRDVDLSRVLFKDFKLQNRMDLVDIKAWPKNNYSIVRTRNTCYDETTAPDADDPTEALRAASRTLGTLESVAKANHNAALASDFAYGRRECDRRADPRWYIRLPKLLFFAWFLGWGEKLLNIVFSSILIITFLAFVFMLWGINVKSDNIYDKVEQPINREFSYSSLVEEPGVVGDYLDCLYFSVVTFTTLGYGDMRPAGQPSKAIAMSESFVGAFTIAILAALYLRRLLT